MNFLQSQIEFSSKYLPVYLQGAKVTLILSAIGVILGLTLGIILALMKISNNKILNTISSIYIEVVRGTPMLVQIMIVYFGLKKVIPESMEILRSPILLCSLSISLNSAAYIAEIIRSGINSIDKGQMEAARSLGLTKSQSMKKVILPQAVKNILPALVNEFITLIKESSVAFTVGVAELMYRGKNLAAQTYEPVRPLVYAAIIYLIMTFTLSKAVEAMERRLSHD